MRRVVHNLHDAVSEEDLKVTRTAHKGRPCQRQQHTSKQQRSLQGGHTRATHHAVILR